MDSYLKAETIGRAKFSSFLELIGANGLPTEDKYDNVDYYFTLKDKKGVAEIKVRYSFYDDYLIEMDKYQALLKKKEGLDYGLYVCFYGNSMYIFSTGIILKYGKPDRKLCKATTVEDNGYRWKDVLLVPTDKAIRLDYEDGKWIKI